MINVTASSHGVKVKKYVDLSFVKLMNTVARCQNAVVVDVIKLFNTLLECDMLRGSIWSTADDCHSTKSHT